MTSKPYPPTKSINVQKDFFNMFMVGVAVILLFVYARIMRNKKHWIYLECAAAAIFVIVSAFLGFWMPDLDSATMYFIRLRGACMVSQAMACYFTENSSDRTVPIAVSISNLLIRGPMLVVLPARLYFGQAKSGIAPLVYPEVFALILLFIGNVYQVMVSRTRIFSHRTVGDPISFHLSIDAIVTFCLGIFVLGFPNMVFSTIMSTVATPNHLWLAKLWGMMLLGGALLSFASLCYRDDEDAVNTLKAKLIIYLAAELLAVTYFIIDAHFRTYGHVGLMIGLMAGLAWNAGHIVFQQEKYD